MGDGEPHEEPDEARPESDEAEDPVTTKMGLMEVSSRLLIKIMKQYCLLL